MYGEPVALHNAVVPSLGFLNVWKPNPGRDFPLKGFPAYKRSRISPCPLLPQSGVADRTTTWLQVLFEISRWLGVREAVVVTDCLCCAPQFYLKE